MRVLLCKVHCPLICFCKPSSHLYTPSPLKLENTQNAPPAPQQPPSPPPSLPPEVNSLEERQSHANGNGNCNGNVNHPSENGLKSSLRKPSTESSVVEKKKVQWVDVLGKQLAEIKEFESSEDESIEYGGVNKGCVCTIL